MQGPRREDLTRISTRPSTKDLYRIMQRPPQEPVYRRIYNVNAADPELENPVAQTLREPAHGLVTRAI